jgi:hypothetical protein
MKELVKEYYIPLKIDEKVIEEKELNVIFSNVKEIVKINSNFLLELEKEYLNFPNTYFSEIFKNYAINHFQYYQEYINNFPMATEAIKNLVKKKKNFQSFLEVRFKKNGSKNLSFYLIMPVQSILYLKLGLPRYRMLLNDLLKNTLKENIEYHSIEESLKLIEHITLSVNENKKKNDNKIILKEVSNLLKGEFNISLNNDFRELIRECNMVKFTFKHKKIENEAFRLLVFNDFILLYEESSNKMKKKKIFLFFFYFMQNLTK